MANMILKAQEDMQDSILVCSYLKERLSTCSYPTPRAQA